MIGLELFKLAFENYIPWIFKEINIKLYKNLTSNLNDEEIEGTLKVTTFYEDEESWWDFDFYIEIPEIIGHYLKLNITFIPPKWNFNFNNSTTQDFANAVMQLMRKGEIDYILDTVFLSEEIFEPDIASLSTGIFDLNQIS